MGWINNSSARPILSIGGLDYSKNLVSFRVSDSSVVTGGIITTTGTVTLAEVRGGSPIEDYKKERFGRATSLRLDLAIGAKIRRHPRGTLLVLDSEWDPAGRRVTLELGCLLSLYQLTNNIENLRSFTPFTLPEEAGFNELANVLAAESAFLWVDQNGAVQKRTFYGGDGLGSDKEPARWVSIRDRTSMAASPLGTGNPVPDRIIVTYSWQTAGDDPDPDDPGGGRQDSDNTISNYWLEHPANIYRTQYVCQPLPGGGNQCANIQINNQKETFGVSKRSSNARYYEGPGGSVSQEISLTEGPAVEVNGSYWAELYSWKVARANNPESIRPEGLNVITQTRRERTYQYGSGGEVTKTVERSYRSLMNAMTQQDWRSSSSAPSTGAFDPDNPPTSNSRGFLTQPPTGMFLSQIVEKTWDYFDDRTVEKTTTTTSAATCGKTGIYSKDGPRTLLNIDADQNGVVTTETRTSRNGLVNPDQPPRNPGGTPTVTSTDIVINDSAKYDPTAAGSITQNFTVPFVIPGDNKERARERATEYAVALRWSLEGDSAGIRVAETMRDEIFNYFPGMPFSFYDPREEKLVKLRMNATTWGVNEREALFSTDGIFIGVSDGTVALGDNTPPAAVTDLQKLLLAAPKPGTTAYDGVAGDLEAAQERLDAIPVAGDEAYELEVFRYQTVVADLEEQKEAVPTGTNADPVLAQTYLDEVARFDAATASAQTSLQAVPQAGDATYDAVVAERDAAQAVIDATPQEGDEAYTEKAAEVVSLQERLLTIPQLGDAPYEDAIATRDGAEAAKNAIPQPGVQTYDDLDTQLADLQTQRDDKVTQLDAVPTPEDAEWQQLTETERQDAVQEAIQIQGEIDDLDVQAEPIQTQLDDWDNQVQGLNTTIAEQQFILDSFDQDYSETAVGITEAQQQLIDWDDEVVAQQAVVDQKESEKQAFDDQAQPFIDEINAERTQLDAWEAEIAAIDESITSEFDQQQQWIDEAAEAEQEKVEAQAQLDAYDAEVQAIRGQINTLVEQSTTEPEVTDEGIIDSGRQGVEISETIEIGLAVGGGFATGNGDDGIGVIDTFNEPFETIKTWNVGIQIQGIKIAGDANLIAAGPGGQLLVDPLDNIITSGLITVDPDLFDPNAVAGPDGIFKIKTGSKKPDAILVVTSAAPPPDRVFTVMKLSDPADLIFEVMTITPINVLVHDQSFNVTRGPSAPSRILSVSVRAPAPDKTFDVRRGPEGVDQTFQTVVVTDPFEITTGVKPLALGFIHFVAVGPDVAPRPSVIHEVTIGGEGYEAPAPDVTIQVRRGPDVPGRFYDLRVIETLQVVSRPAPFEVTVGADVPNQVFEVISSAPPADQVFDVVTQEFTFQISVGPGLFTQRFVIDRMEKPLVITVDAPPADQVFRIAKDKTISVYVGPEAPDSSFDVMVAGLPDQTFALSVIDTIQVASLEQSFSISTGAEAISFEVTVA